MPINTGGLAQRRASPAALARRLGCAVDRRGRAGGERPEHLRRPCRPRGRSRAISSVPGAAVTLTEVETGVMQSAVTRCAGHVLVRPAEARRLQARESPRSGFKSTNVQDIRIQVGQRARVDVKLVVATVAEDGDRVGGGRDADQRRERGDRPGDGQQGRSSSCRSTAATSSSSRSSPPAPCRSASACRRPRPGRAAATRRCRSRAAASRTTASSSTASRPATPASATPASGPSIDAIQEVKIQRSTFGAEFGRSAAVVNTTIKSGTNELHGSVFEFNRDEQVRCERLLPEPHEPRQAAVQAEQLRHRRRRSADCSRSCTTAATARSGSSTTKGSGRTCTSSATGLYPSAAQLRGNLADDSAGTGIFPTQLRRSARPTPGSRKCVDVIDSTTGQPFPGNVIPAEPARSDHAARDAVHRAAERRRCRPERADVSRASTRLPRR